MHTMSVNPPSLGGRCLSEVKFVCLIPLMSLREEPYVDITIALCVPPLPNPVPTPLALPCASVQWAHEAAQPEPQVVPQVV